MKESTPPINCQYNIFIVVFKMQNNFNVIYSSNAQAFIKKASMTVGTDNKLAIRVNIYDLRNVAVL